LPGQEVLLKVCWAWNVGINEAVYFEIATPLGPPMLFGIFHCSWVVVGVGLHAVAFVGGVGARGQMVVPNPVEFGVNRYRL